MELFENNTKSAIISECGNYRYSLHRTWNNQMPSVMFVMLNPSTADDKQDDPTIKRCINFAKSWNYGGIIVCNLFAYRATNPKELLSVHNPFGDQNIYYTKNNADKVPAIICAWGNEPILKKVLKNMSPVSLLHFALDKLYYLELSKNGVPKHPLYLKNTLTPKKLIIDVKSNYV